MQDYKRLCLADAPLTDVRRNSQSQGSCPRRGRYAATWIGWEVTIGVTVHDEMSGLRPNGEDGGLLRQQLWEKFQKICRQESIDGLELGRTVEFEFKRCYKNLGATHETTLVHLILERLNRAQSVERWVIFKPLSSQKIAYNANMLATARRGLAFKEGTVSEATPTHTVQDVPEGTGVAPEIQKSPWTPRLEKYKQAMGPVHMSRRNPRFSKLLMEEMGKAITIETY